MDILLKDNRNKIPYLQNLIDIANEDKCHCGYLLKVRLIQSEKSRYQGQFYASCYYKTGYSKAEYCKSWYFPQEAPKSTKGYILTSNGVGNNPDRAFYSTLEKNKCMLIKCNTNIQIIQELSERLGQSTQNFGGISFTKQLNKSDFTEIQQQNALLQRIINNQQNKIKLLSNTLGL